MITKPYASALITLCILVFASGCNHNVFLDGPDTPDNTSATVEGDGGETTFSIPTKGLEHISFDLTSEAQKYCTYYNSRGEIIDRSSPASEASKIVIDNDLIRQELVKNGNRLVFTSVSNTRDAFNLVIRLEYDYTVKFINIEILPGQPMELVEVNYDPDIEITDSAEVKTRSTGFTNHSSIPQTLEVHPYLQEMASILVEPSKYGSWTKGEKITMPVSVYDNGNWEMKEIAGIRPGTSYQYPRPDRMMTVYVDIPANSSVNAFTDVTYSKAEAHGTLFFLNPILDRQLSVDFTCTSLYPSSYKIRVENAK